MGANDIIHRSYLLDTDSSERSSKSLLHRMHKLWQIIKNFYGKHLRQANASHTHTCVRGQVCLVFIENPKSYSKWNLKCFCARIIFNGISFVLNSSGALSFDRAYAFSKSLPCVRELFSSLNGMRNYIWYARTLPYELMLTVTTQRMTRKKFSAAERRKNSSTKLWDRISKQTRENLGICSAPAHISRIIRV